MGGQDFKTIHAWVKKYFLWARVVLLKCALLAFKRPALTLERRFYALIQFLHEELARLPQFEIHVGYRFFAFVRDIDRRDRLSRRPPDAP